MSPLEAAKKADEEISALHRAFGAPGDYGYESREGRALFALYRFQSELRAVISQAEDPRFFIVNAVIHDRVTGKHVAIQGTWAWSADQ